MTEYPIFTDNIEANEYIFRFRGKTAEGNLVSGRDRLPFRFEQEIRTEFIKKSTKIRVYVVSFKKGTTIPIPDVGSKIYLEISPSIDERSISSEYSKEISETGDADFGWLDIPSGYTESNQRIIVRLSQTTPASIKNIEYDIKVYFQ